MPTVNKHLAVALLTDGNDLASIACSLTSVVTGTLIPGLVTVYWANPDLRTDSFVLNQLGHLSMIYHGIFRHVFIAKHRNGIRAYRDYVVRESPVSSLVLLDDDVVVEADAVENLHSHYQHAKDFMAKATNTALAFVAGSKCDVSNTRGYSDFTREFQAFPLDVTKADTHTPYWGQTSGARHDPILCARPDTGFMLVDVDVLRRQNLHFSTHSQHAPQACGEDSVFGELCKHRGCPGVFTPSARAWHLEKPKVRFDNLAAREEIVQRTLDSIIPLSDPPIT